MKKTLCITLAAIMTAGTVAVHATSLVNSGTKKTIKIPSKIICDISKLGVSTQKEKGRTYKFKKKNIENAKLKNNNYYWAEMPDEAKTIAGEIKEIEKQMKLASSEICEELKIKTDELKANLKTDELKGEQKKELFKAFNTENKQLFDKIDEIRKPFMEQIKEKQKQIYEIVKAKRQAQQNTN